MNDFNNQDPELELSFEERFKLTVEKLRPYIKTLWEQRWKMVWINVSVAVVTVLILLFWVKPFYDSSIVILPDYGNNSKGMLSQLSGLASLAGVQVGQSDPSGIYEQLVSSEAILDSVIFQKYIVQKFDRPVNLIDYFEIDPEKDLPDSLQNRQRYLEVFKDLTKNRIKAVADVSTSILTISVRMPESRLSADVANQIAVSLNNYVVNQSSFHAKNQRIYLEKRVEEVKDSLSEAENKLKYFNENNRFVDQSPALLLIQKRLYRNVEITNAIYLELVKQLELAKLDEKKDTPIINVEQYAKDPIKKTGPQRAVLLISIMFFFFLISALYFISLSFLKKCFRILKGVQIS